VGNQARCDEVRASLGTPTEGVLGPGVLPPAGERGGACVVVVRRLVAVGTALVYGQLRDAGPIERVTLRSGSYADFRQVLTREAPADVSVPATSAFRAAAGSLPVRWWWSNTIGGFQEANEGLARGGASPEAGSRR